MSRDFANIAGDNLVGSFAPVNAVPLSMAIWFNSDVSNTGTSDVLAGIGVSGVQTHSWHIEIGITAGRVSAVVRDGTTSSALTSGAGSTYSIGAWAHALAVFESNAIRRVYCNGGAKSNTATPTLTPVGVNEVRLGQNGAAGDRADGRLAHFALWNVALSDDDAEALGTSRMSPLLVRRANLVAYWPMIGRNAGEIDVVGGRILTVNGTTISTDEPPMMHRASRRQIFLPFVGVAPAFDAGPTIQSVTASQYTLACTPSASATWYAVAVKAGDTAPSGAQVKAGQNAAGAAALAANSKAITGADTMTLGGSLTRPYHDVHTVLDNGGGTSSVASLGNAILTAVAGRQYALVVLPLPAEEDEDSFLPGASPAAATNDLQECSLLTSRGHPVEISSGGVANIASGGDRARKTIGFRFWDRSLDDWSDASPVTEYIDNQPPGLTNDSIDISLLVSQSMTPLSLLGVFSDAEGDTLTGSVTSGTLPTGTAVSGGGSWTGVPSVLNQTGSFEYTATDIAGDSAVLLVGWEVTTPTADVIPSIVGLTQEIATGLILGAGFLYRITQEVHSTLAAGLVIRSDPAAGVLTNLGTEVEIVVSKGQGNAPRNFVGVAVNASKIHLTWSA